MSLYRCDLHIHSCLSPCGDEDMTPGNIVGMSLLNGLQIVALTDHNSTKNCPAFFKIAREHGIIPVAGMELTTAEDIHVVCLFESLADALAFGEEVDGRRIRFPNRVDIFGDQLVVDENDEVLGIEADLLSNATTVTLDEAPTLVERYRGICYPAHVDREANGILATLGMLPERPQFQIAEFHDAQKVEAYCVKHPPLKGMRTVIGSDAHYLWDIRDRAHYFELEDEPYSGDFVRSQLFRLLKEGTH